MTMTSPMRERGSLGGFLRVRGRFHWLGDQ
jgi:hypothetical protein